MDRLNRIRALIGLVALSLISGGFEAVAEDEILAPGWKNLTYEPPAVGSYQLPPITNASDGAVLLEDGQESQLFDLMGDRLVLFSFIYTRCNDINGCPLANAVFHKLQAKLQERPDVAQATRLLSISFDPERDTPEVMQEFGQGLGGDGVDWQFLTTRDRETLEPILDDYGQYTIREYDESGEYTGDFAHMLRVFLIDRELRVRNIYSVAFLHADILINDLETLLLESPSS
ncbi:MAG: SCO family protein [Gammaproteobacteria bacterium]|nr:SCO family protein [Gammaproteobacteria bacterium]MDE0302185.1 SCO family protein [Gammaproteobacteria bacterium]